jgi:DNA segregation ATPase FtsK/SpoIIIE-like protein
MAKTDTAVSPAASEVAAPVVNLNKATKEEETETVAPPLELDSASEPEPPVIAPKKSEPQIQQPLWEALQEIETGQPEYEDELMPEAIALVQQLNKASTSLLQRRFRIGYTRAARMIDTMEELGIIGPPTGTSKAREVLLGNGTEVVDEENQEEDEEKDEVAEE